MLKQLQIHTQSMRAVGMLRVAAAVVMAGVALFLAVSSVAAEENGSFPIESKVILSATEYDYPPFCVLDSAGRPDGFSVQLLRAALAAMDYQVQFDLVGPWSEVKQSLVDAQVQALPLVGRTPEREDIFDFTFPYLTMHGTIVVRQEEEGVESVDDLVGRQVAVMKDDNAEEFLRRATTGVDIVTRESFEVALRELAQGQHDAVITQRLVALQLINQIGADNLKLAGGPMKDFTQTFSFAVREGDKELLSILNEGLALVIADGTYRRLHAEWFGPIEERVRQRSRIVVGGDSDFPPFEYLDANGRPAGYNVELTRAIAKEMGLDVSIELKPWAQIWKEIQENRIDVLQGIFYSPERDDTFDFSPAHAVIGYTFVAREGGRVPRNLSDLSDLSILVQKNDIMHQMLLDLGRDDQIVAVESPEEALRQLANGNHDCALVPKILSRYLISQYGWQNLRVSERTVRAPEYCYGVLNGNDWLLSRFSEGLANLKATGEYRRIYAKWLGPYQERRTEFSDVIEPLLWVVVPAFLLLGAAFVWTRTLRIKVRQSTAELRAEIAERKQAQEQLLAAKVAAEQATRAKSEFLANMSHEIRTPLNGLLGMLQHLESTPLQPEQFEYVETALGSGQRLMGVLNDILDLSRIEAGKMDLERECFDPARVVREVAGIFQANAAAKNIALHCEIEPELPWVLSDEGRLRQILFNLVGNAVKFTERGEVSVTARVQPEERSLEQGTPVQVVLAFEVADTGIGIPTDKLVGLFEPFTQVDGTHARKYGGSGLGLGIVRRLVDLMGGDIDIHSKPGCGTRVSFSLPLAVAEAESCRENVGRNSEKEHLLGSLNILVAEDERVNRMIIERLLTKQGHRVVAVMDGHHCLRALDEDDFDVILMDIQMPEMDGLETARAIRARDDDKRDVPIVALTAHAMKGDRETFLAAGMDDYLSKPVDFNEVSRVLGRVVAG